MGACASKAQDTQDLPRDFEFLSKVAQGSLSTIWLSRDQATGELVAVKLFPRGFSEKSLRSLQVEVEVQCQLRHPNLLHPREVFIDANYFGIVLPYESGGDLYSYAKRRATPEPLARYFMFQLLSAVKHCHDRHVAHRDIKLENIFLDSRNPPILRLADFGVAKAWRRARSRRMHTLAGTPGYFAPQVLGAALLPEHTAYDACKADVWACGVVLASLILRRNPYSNLWEQAYNEREQLRAQWIAEMETSWSKDNDKQGQVSHMSTELRDLLNHLLDPEEDTRITAQAALQHPWFTSSPLPAKLQKSLDGIVAELDSVSKHGRDNDMVLEEEADALSLDRIFELARDKDAPLSRPLLRLRTEDMTFSYPISARTLGRNASQPGHVDELPIPHMGIDDFGASDTVLEDQNVTPAAVK